MIVDFVRNGLVLLALALALAACGCGRTTEAAPRPRVVTLGEQDDGVRREVPAAATLVLELPGNPTTGYRWELTNADPPLANPTSSYVPAARDREGAGGTFRFEWTMPADEGELAASFAYRRPFEKGVAPLREFHLRVHVAR